MGEALVIPRSAILASRERLLVTVLPRPRILPLLRHHHGG